MVWGIDFSPKGTEALYREHNGKLLIELELHNIMQIFNSFDPAPFHEKEGLILLLLYAIKSSNCYEI